jgi:hypothetical protein
MIEPHEVLELLVNACPTFALARDEHLADHGADLLYTAAGSFADHLLSLQETNQTDSFVSVGAAIELLYAEGSPWVKEWATIGLLEGIQNGWLNRGANPDLFFPYLGQEGKSWWSGLNNFWSGEAPYVKK